MECGAGKGREGASPPVGVGGGGVVEGGAAFTVGLVDAGPGGHQRDGALVAAVGGCIVQWGPGEKRRSGEKRIRGRSKRNQRRSQKLPCNALPPWFPTPHPGLHHFLHHWSLQSGAFSAYTHSCTLTHLPNLSLRLKSAPLLNSKLRHSTFLEGRKVQVHQRRRFWEEPRGSPQGGRTWTALSAASFSPARGGLLWAGEKEGSRLRPRRLREAWGREGGTRAHPPEAAA